ncbi:MAG: Ig-like domain-containing protein, partial [Nanoarchaeota archaeon]|nr:Ig-like domain-containing protein [Nanoarchaeota archaeon]
ATINNTWFSDSTPEIGFNITDNLDTALNYSILINESVDNINYVANRTRKNYNISSQLNGSYGIIIEAHDNANNTINSTSLIIFIDTAPPIPLILTQNGSNFSNSTPGININITDNLDSELNYTFYIDFTTQSTTGYLSNGVNDTINLSTLSDGYYNITVEATDEANNKQNSTFIQILVDTQPPVVTIQNPSPNEATGYLINLTSTVTDSGVGIDAVTYVLINDSGYVYQNGSLNSTDSWDVMWNSTTDLPNEGFIYINFTIIANDTLGNTNTTVVRFVIDNVAPSINFIVPDGDYFNDDFSLLIAVTNRNLTKSHYNITNSTFDLVINNSNNSISATSFTWSDYINISNTTKWPEGRYNITVFAIDDVSNNRTLHNFFYIDRTGPNVTLLLPVDYYNTSNTTIEFNFTVIDNFDTVLICNLTINGTVEHSDFIVINGTVMNRTLKGIEEGTQLWNVTCKDDATNANTSLSRWFTVDTSAPIISLVTPSNNHWNGTANITFSYTPYDTYTTLSNCSLIINGTINQTNTSIVEGAENTFDVYNIPEGAYNWTVNCSDTVGNIGTNLSERRFYVDQTVPTVNITTNNGTWFSDSTPEIYFNISDNLDSTLNYTFYIDNTPSTNGTASNGIIRSDNLTSLSNGSFIIILEAWDEVNGRFNSSPITIFVDTVQPTITLLAPANGSNTTQNVEFNFTITDNMAVNLSCNISLDNVVNISDIPAGNGSVINNTVPSIVDGYHNWSVTCIDNATNSQTSAIWYFNVTPPDLFIDRSLITFNDTSPLEGRNVTINATIKNIGFSDAQNALVQFFNGDPDDGGVQINGDKWINLTFGSNVTLSVNWTVLLGTTYIFVRIDPSNTITELNEDNNKANKSITVVSWHTVYGENVGDLRITGASNKSIFSWYVSNVSSGNVFATDYDSSITWSNLTAIGRNVSGQNASDDFEEIDVALGSTNFTDSINRTYTSSSNPKNITSFIIFSNTIYNVSIANSTNTSNFVTGILWDMSDDTNGEYNGTEDIVFVSKINPQALGRYGIYDYEMRVPSELKKYKKTDLGYVAFYVELK